MDDSHRIPAEVLAMAERVGEFIEYWGFKHVEGKIWGIIFLSRQPRDMTYLAEQLGLSKALVSMAVARLLEYNVIKPAHPDRQRYQAYEANPNVIEVIFNVLRSRERVMLSRIQSAAKELSGLSENKLKDAGYSSRRVAFLSKMVKFATVVLDSTVALKAWDLSLLKKIASERNETE
jgi:DNA-binding transcriptional regulator GbsR (MarR family)